MAEVFVASTIGAEGFSRRVAIKRVLPGYSENPQFAQMFISEAQLSSRLQHPNIVSVVDFDRDAEGRLFLVMELVEGKDLDALLSTGLLPFPAVIFVLTEMLRGLGYAHDLPIAGDELQGIVHRDVSPHNVLLSWEGAVKVSDFGIAKARAASEATASVFIKGKPAYMSPEQANGEPLDGRSDLFAVGIMMWEMLVGRRLFVGGDTRSLLAQVLFSPIPRPRQQRSEVPKDLDRICMKMLERELPARYGSGEEIIADLLRCDDAPKGGREEVVALLAERFASEVPRRHSRRGTARPSGEGAAVPTPLPFRPAPPPSGASVRPERTPQPTAETLVGHGAAPTSYSELPPMSSMGSVGSVGPPGPLRSGGPVGGYSVDQMMSAHTRTQLPPAAGPLRRRRAPALVAGGLLAALSVVAIALATRSPAAPAAGGPDASTANAGVAIADAAAPDEGAPVDGAATAPVDDAADAGIATAPELAEPVDAKPAERPPAARRGRAEITFSADPPMQVNVDGKNLGSTPHVRVLDAGAHRVKFSNPDTGVVDRFSIEVEAGKPKTVYRRYQH